MMDVEEACGVFEGVASQAQRDHVVRLFQLAIASGFESAFDILLRANLRAAHPSTDPSVIDRLVDATLTLARSTPPRSASSLH